MAYPEEARPELPPLVRLAALGRFAGVLGSLLLNVERSGLRIWHPPLCTSSPSTVVRARITLDCPDMIGSCVGMSISGEPAAGCGVLAARGAAVVAAIAAYSQMGAPHRSLVQ